MPELAFGFRQRVNSFIEYSIMRSEQPWGEYPIGVIVFQQGGGIKRDPHVAAYLGVKMGNTTFEGILDACDRKRLTICHNGSPYGAIVEVPEETDKPTSLWQRLFRGKRKWKILVGDNRCGDVSLQYPVFLSHQLFFRMNNGIELPISVSRRANMSSGGGVRCVSGLVGALLKMEKPKQEYGDMIIPLNTPRYCGSGCDYNIERMHFLLNVLFRTLFMHLDFDGSSD